MLEDAHLITFFEQLFVKNGMDPQLAEFLNLIINVAGLLLVLYVISLLSKRFLIRTFEAFTHKTKTNFDNFLLQSNFPRWISYLIPLLLLMVSVPLIFESYPRLLGLLKTLFNLSLIVLSVLIVRSILRSLQGYLRTKERFKDKPMESYIQVMMIFFWAIGLVFIFSELTGKDVLDFLISLGAASAIILLIFKDTILGFVASIQVSVNDIVRLGDWITFSKYGADGFVTEINLATVRVQNWDKTYTTIPTYSLISDSFQNWRGMEESEGRRIKRSIFIKQSSIRFVSEEDLEGFKKFNLIKPYLEERQKEIDDFNNTHNFDRSVIINGRNQTNLGIFRHYAEAYLRNHPKINQDMWVIVRHQDPTPHGIPLEIYCFSSDKRWVYYEDIAGDVFDHLIAVLPYFDLKIFEDPSGDDITRIAQNFQGLGSKEA